MVTNWAILTNTYTARCILLHWMLILRNVFYTIGPLWYESTSHHTICLYECAYLLPRQIPICNSVAGHQIATNFCTCHDSTAVVPCTKFCSDHCIRIEMRVKRNFHRIWIAMEKPLLKRLVILCKEGRRWKIKSNMISLKHLLREQQLNQTNQCNTLLNTTKFSFQS